VSFHNTIYDMTLLHAWTHGNLGLYTVEPREGCEMRADHSGTFFSTVCSNRLDCARDGHAECRCPEARNPGSDDNGPDTNDHRHRRGLFLRERQQPEIGEKGCGGRRSVFGGGAGCSCHTLFDLISPLACDRNLRRVQCGDVLLCAHVR
jgi:hypothetical protein